MLGLSGYKSEHLVFAMVLAQELSEGSSSSFEQPPS